MENPALLLLPGLLNDARLWQQQISDLADMADATVADLTDADSIPALAASALAQAPTERFALAGLSMGGYVALEIMRQAPERVSGLALLDTTARPDTVEATEGRHKLMQLAETDFPAVLAALLPKLVHPAHLQNKAIVNIITSMANSVGKTAFLRQQQAIIGRMDNRHFLRQITCPALVLCGRDDIITPVALHEEMATRVTDSRLVIIEKCGHLSALEQPQQVSAALKEWLLRISPE